MTSNQIKTETYALSKNAALSAIATTLMLSITLVLTFFLSDEISDSVRNALSLCAAVIIPSVFPFIIISELLYCFIDFSPMKKLCSMFERLFKINRAGLYPFALGILCGFPLGVKCAAELYTEGRISKDECERLIGFCNNTGPAFLVCGIGLGLRNNIYDGIALYAATVLSAILVGMIFSVGEASSQIDKGLYSRSSFSMTRSIKNAGIGCLNICSYLTFFSCIVGFIKAIFGKGLIYIFTVPFLEIGTATDILSKTELLGNISSLALTAFSVGFSGLSVHLQALSFLSDTDVRTGKYFVMKLIQGIIATALVTVAYPFFH